MTNEHNDQQRLPYERKTSFWCVVRCKTHAMTNAEEKNSFFAFVCAMAVSTCMEIAYIVAN